MFSPERSRQLIVQPTSRQGALGAWGLVQLLLVFACVWQAWGSVPGGGWGSVVNVVVNIHCKYFGVGFAFSLVTRAFLKNLVFGMWFLIFTNAFLIICDTRHVCPVL